VQGRETVFLQPTQIPTEVEEPNIPNQREARLLEFDEEDIVDEESSIPEMLESSEYEPQVFPTTLASTPGTSSDLEYINFMADSSSLIPEHKESVPSSKVSLVTSEPEVSWTDYEKLINPNALIVHESVIV